MNLGIERLISEFHRIAKKRWIKSISKSFGSVGLTFEKELHKKPDALYLPDYYGTEIKCTSKTSHYPLFLFTIAFDGPRENEISYIVEKYGYYDKDYTDKKVLFEKLNFSQKRLVNKLYKFQLSYEEKEKKIYLNVFNLKNKLIEKESFIYLDSLNEHLNIKLNKLALVYSDYKVINNEKYFYYYEIIIYELYNFEVFLKLLINDCLEVSLISRIGKSGNDSGRYRNKNLVIAIKKDRIEKLFQKLYHFNYNKY